MMLQVQPLEPVRTGNGEADDHEPGERTGRAWICSLPESHRVCPGGRVRALVLPQELPDGDRSVRDARDDHPEQLLPDGVDG